MKSNNTVLTFILGLVASIILPGCSLVKPHDYRDANAGTYDYSNYYDERVASDGGYAGNYYNSGYDHMPYYESSVVSVPKSYHVNEYGSPVSHKDRDRLWVKRQNPRNYTIEVANGKKASKVAKTLTRTPKNERMAQIRYRKQGQSQYRGVYGSYKTRAKAREALQKLPADIRAKAGVQQWGNVQQNIDSSSTPKLSLPKIQ